MWCMYCVWHVVHMAYVHGMHVCAVCGIACANGVCVCSMIVCGMYDGGM